MSVLERGRESGSDGTYERNVEDQKTHRKIRKKREKQSNTHTCTRIT